jgi:hypothetical protein
MARATATLRTVKPVPSDRGGVRLGEAVQQGISAPAERGKQEGVLEVVCVIV